MTNDERRLACLEARLTVHDNDVAWADVHAALMRQQARVRLSPRHKILDTGAHGSWPYRVACIP